MTEIATPRGAEGLAALLGQVRIIESDGEAGRAGVEYLATMAMCHSGGVVQGGFIAGWLDQAMSMAVMATHDHELSPMTLEMKVSYFAPAGPGTVIAEGWVERAGRSTAFLEGRLLNGRGEILAKASATARLIPRARVEQRAREQLGE